MADGIKIDVSIDGRQAETTVKGLDKQLQGFAKSGSAGFNRVTSAFDVFKGALGAGIALKGIDAVIGGINSLVGEFQKGIELASIQENALNKLNTSLALAGSFSKEASQDFQDFASSLQQVTTVGDETILQAAALARNFTKTNEEAKALTAAAIDLSAATGLSLDGAIKNLGKTLGGLTGELGESVPALRSLTKEQLQAGAAIELVANRFGGAATGAVRTFAGASAQLNNTIGDTREILGGFVTQNPAVIGAINAINKVFINLQKILQANSSQVEAFFNSLIDSTFRGAKQLVGAFEVVGNLADVLVRSFNAVVASIQAAGNTFALGITAPLALIEQGINKITGKDFNFLTNESKRLADEVNRNISSIGTNLTETGFLADATTGLVNFSENAIAIVESTVEQQRALYEQDKDAFLENLSAKQLATTGGEEGLSPEVIAERQKQADILAIRQQGALEQEEFEINKRILAEEQTALDLERLKEIEIEKQNIVFEAEIAKANLIRDERQRSLALQDIAAKQEVAITKTKNAQILADEKRRLELDKQIKAANIQATQNFLQTGINLAKQGSRAQKGLQTAQALISTFTAANQALSSPPGPPFTIPLVASTIALGLGNVAKINGVGGFQDGGFVGARPSTPRTGDRVLARLNPNEFIANQQQQRNILQAVADGNFQGGNNIQDQINGLITAIVNSPVTLEIDGREIARATRDQSLQGFAV